jgi:hypothetical protein
MGGYQPPNDMEFSGHLSRERGEWRRWSAATTGQASDRASELLPHGLALKAQGASEDVETGRIVPPKLGILRPLGANPTVVELAHENHLSTTADRDLLALDPDRHAKSLYVLARCLSDCFPRSVRADLEDKVLKVIEPCQLPFDEREASYATIAPQRDLLGFASHKRPTKVGQILGEEDIHRRRNGLGDLIRHGVA